VKVGGLHIGEVAEMSIRRAGEWFADLPKSLSPKQNEIATRILKRSASASNSWSMSGWNISRSRARPHAVGGESQRIRLASQIGSGLTGVLYVLDEPSIACTSATMRACSRP